MDRFQLAGITILVSEEVVEGSGGVLVFTFQGFLDKSTAKESQVFLLSEIAKSDLKVVVFDFAGLTYINSEGIGLLMMMKATLEKSDRFLLIRSLLPQVADIFNAVGVQSLVECFSSVQDCNKRITEILNSK